MSYSDEKTTRILISAKQLREIIEKHPEVEVELMRKAIPQIQEDLRRRSAQVIVDDITQRVRERFVPSRFPYRLPDEVIQVLDETIAKRMSDEIVRAAVNSAELRIGKQVDDWFKKHEPRITEIIATRIGLVVDEIIRLKK